MANFSCKLVSWKCNASTEDFGEAESVLVEFLLAAYLLMEAGAFGVLFFTDNEGCGVALLDCENFNLLIGIVSSSSMSRGSWRLFPGFMWVVAFGSSICLQCSFSEWAGVVWLEDPTSKRLLKLCTLGSAMIRSSDCLGFMLCQITWRHSMEAMPFFNAAVSLERSHLQYRGNASGCDGWISFVLSQNQYCKIEQRDN